MDLAEYIDRKGFTQKTFADMVGCDRNHLNAVINGRVRMNLRFARRIDEITGGIVKAEELLELNKIVGQDLEKVI